MGKVIEKYKSKEFLIREYISKRKSAYSIAKHIGCSYQTIYRYLNRHNIESRTRSAALKGISRPKNGKKI